MPSECIELPLADVFYQQWNYPRECFYHFAAPEIFHAKGYEFSMYVDGDTFTYRSLTDDDLPSACIAGYGYQTIGEFFFEIGEHMRCWRNVASTISPSTSRGFRGTAVSGRSTITFATAGGRDSIHCRARS